MKMAAKRARTDIDMEQLFLDPPAARADDTAVVQAALAIRNIDVEGWIGVMPMDKLEALSNELNDSVRTGNVDHVARLCCPFIQEDAALTAAEARIKFAKMWIQFSFKKAYQRYMLAKKGGLPKFASIVETAHVVRRDREARG